MKRIIALAALILFAMTGTAQAKADDPKDACKHGGFSQYVNPATEQPFTSQGQCVSYVAQGGTLVPVLPQSVPVIEAFDYSVPLYDNYSVGLRASGFTPESSVLFEVRFTRNGVTTLEGWKTVTMDSDGAWTEAASIVVFCGAPATVTMTGDGLVAALQVPEPAGC